MVNVYIDGIWCNDCRRMHPTLKWHQKYNEYELNRKEKWEEEKAKRPSLFNDAEYEDTLSVKGLIENESEQPCIICGHDTYFSNIKTGNYVCSDKCKYADDGYVEDNFYTPQEIEIIKGDVSFNKSELIDHIMKIMVDPTLTKTESNNIVRLLHKVKEEDIPTIVPDFTSSKIEGYYVNISEGYYEKAVGEDFFFEYDNKEHKLFLSSFSWS